MVLAVFDLPPMAGPIRLQSPIHKTECLRMDRQTKHLQVGLVLAGTDSTMLLLLRLGTKGSLALEDMKARESRMGPILKIGPLVEG
jgi:hypothetical protein